MIFSSLWPEKKTVIIMPKIHIELHFLRFSDVKGHENIKKLIRKVIQVICFTLNHKHLSRSQLQFQMEFPVTNSSKVEFMVFVYILCT